MPIWPALITLLNVLLLAALSGIVGHGRGRYGIKAPAMTGHPLFERRVRVHMNTLESTLVFLPTLWIAALYATAAGAGVAGLVWVAARIWYALAYLRDPARRGPGFGLAALAWLALLLMACWGLLRHVIGR